MDSKVAAFAATPDPTFGQQAPAKPRPAIGAAASQPAPSQDPADLRLIIEEDKATNSYVYKTINRRTGEVVQQLPREHVLKLQEDVDYAAGQVVQTEA